MSVTKNDVSYNYFLFDCVKADEVLPSEPTTQTATETSSTEPTTAEPTTETTESTDSTEDISTEPATAPRYQLGDVNRDGNFNIKDATEIQKYLAKLVEFDGEQKALADFDGNGTINIKDATAIQMKLAKLA